MLMGKLLISRFKICFLDQAIYEQIQLIFFERDLFHHAGMPG